MVEQDKPISEKSIRILRMTVFFARFGGRIKNHLLYEKSHHNSRFKLGYGSRGRVQGCILTQIKCMTLNIEQIVQHKHF